ncbi:MAG TPA: type II CAAX endopeptidase family protein [Acidimicrobiia bacterium]|nr:type II CAAX endopeptidase family protein [Acidimicrobiia bacterium]
MSNISQSRVPVLALVVVVALFSLDFLAGWTYGLVAMLAMVAVGLAFRRAYPNQRLLWWRPDGKDLIAVAVMYVGVVAAVGLAFLRFTVDAMVGLFISYAVVGLLLLGVVGPVVYTVWWRKRPLRSLGVGLDQWRPTVVLALVFAAAQFSLTLWGYDLPQPVDWMPLLLMSLTVGVFESIFFRGFIQNRLEQAFGPVVGIGSASLLYGFYHLGYGMGMGEIAFLTGLGVVYAMAFATTRNLLVLWPLLTPLGSFFNNLTGGDIELPWASMIGFGEVLVAMGVVLWLAHRRSARRSIPVNEEPRVEGTGELLLAGQKGPQLGDFTRTSR